MTHDELLAKIDAPNKGNQDWYDEEIVWRKALRTVVELHKPAEAWGDTHCGFCYDLAWEPSGLEMDAKDFVYPCATIRAIEKELQ